jgi:hypothetical protein
MPNGGGRSAAATAPALRSSRVLSNEADEARSGTKPPRDFNRGASPAQGSHLSGGAWPSPAEACDSIVAAPGVESFSARALVSRAELATSQGPMSTPIYRGNRPGRTQTTSRILRRGNPTGIAEFC